LAVKKSEAWQLLPDDVVARDLLAFTWLFQLAFSRKMAMEMLEISGNVVIYQVNHGNS